VRPGAQVGAVTNPVWAGGSAGSSSTSNADCSFSERRSPNFRTPRTDVSEATPCAAVHRPVPHSCRPGDRAWLGAHQPQPTSASSTDFARARTRPATRPTRGPHPRIRARRMTRRVSAPHIFFAAIVRSRQRGLPPFETSVISDCLSPRQRAAQCRRSPLPRRRCSEAVASPRRRSGQCTGWRFPDR
jgi:hypothetical protein